MLTGIGGGLARDLLTGEIPVVLRREIYALAALLGAIAVVAADRLGRADRCRRSSARPCWSSRDRAGPRCVALGALVARR